MDKTDKEIFSKVWRGHNTHEYINVFPIIELWEVWGWITIETPSPPSGYVPISITELGKSIIIFNDL